MRISTPKNLFVENHLYTEYDKDGNKNIALEESFASLEGEADRIVEKIVGAARAGQLPNLSLTERATWDRFFFIQWKRVPDFHEKIAITYFEEESIPALLAEFEEKFRPLTDKERQEFQKPETLKRIRRNAKVHSLADPSQEVQEVLSRKGLGIAVISDPKKSIIIGSFPVVKLTFPGRTNLADPSVEVWLPISRDVVVGVTPFPNTEKLVAIANHDICALNLLISKQSTIIAGPSRALISSLSTPR